MIQPGNSSALWSTTGMMKGSLLSQHSSILDLFYSVRNRIREGHPDFIVTADSWPAFLYPHGLANEDQVDGGLFKSAILVKVSIPLYLRFLDYIGFHYRLSNFCLLRPLQQKMFVVRKTLRINPLDLSSAPKIGRLQHAAMLPIF
jgi:hypothetical protein